MSYTRAPTSLSACCSGCATGAPCAGTSPRASLGDFSLTSPWVLLLGGYLAWKLMSRRAVKKRAAEYKASRERLFGTDSHDEWMRKHPHIKWR